MRVLRIIAWTVGALVVVVALGIGAVVLLVQSPQLLSYVEKQAGAMSGHQTKIGKISVRWGETIHVDLADVEIANTDWAKTPDMFKARRIEFDLRARPLLHGNIVIPRLRLEQPEIDLEQDAKGESNWSPDQSPIASAAAQQAAPARRAETPLIGQLQIDGGRLSYHDAKRYLGLDGTVQTATGQAGAQPQAELSLKGTLESQPLTVRFVGGSVLMLRDTKTPYPVDLEIAYGGTRLAVKGTLVDPFQYKGADVTLTLSGPNLADIYPLLGIPGPPTPPYRITGKLDHQPKLWHVSNTAWHVGDTDLAGDIVIDQNVKPAKLTANLTSGNLVFADLAPMVGAAPDKKNGSVSAEQKQTEQQLEARKDLFPNVPLHTERLRAMNMDVTLAARRVIAPSYLPIEAIAARVQVADGQATVQPLHMELGGGMVAGNLAIDARSDVPAVRADLDIDDVDLGAFFRGSRFFDTTEGKVRGRVALAGRGRSLAQVMGSASGDIAFAMTDATISNLMVSLAGLEIADALVLYVGGDNRIPIRCAMGKLDFDQGTVTFVDTLMDTRKSVLRFNTAAPTSRRRPSTARSRRARSSSTCSTCTGRSSSKARSDRRRSRWPRHSHSDAGFRQCQGRALRRTHPATPGGEALDWCGAADRPPVGE